MKFLVLILSVLKITVKIFIKFGVINTSNKIRYYPELNTLDINVSGQSASSEIEQRILTRKPLMVAKFGTSELDIVIHYRYMKTKKLGEKISNYLYFNKDLWWEKRRAFALHNNAGFFPISHRNLSLFSELMIDSMKQVDILGSWIQGENLFREELRSALICNLPDLEPYYHEIPWSRALSGKRVLVVHPFSDSISNQYKQNREKLFTCKEILSEFTLITYKAVQSIALQRTEFPSWFDALEKMTNDIAKIQFDVAIIGCGAYGFPLAAKIKMMGKQAIHLGGATQIMFGIIGKRWEEMPTVSKFFNEYWVRPGKLEVPENANNVENGCYW